ncbi:MAG: sigma-54-dependent transcriptional regulator, partial [Alphaproteobacteria bacterium]
MPGETALAVDQDSASLALLTSVLQREGLQVRKAASATQALNLLSGVPVDLVVAEMNVPDGGGLRVLTHVQRHTPSVPVILIAHNGSIEEAVAAVRKGAHSYLSKPLQEGSLKLALLRALESRHVLRENSALKKRLAPRGELSGLISGDYRMAKVRNTILRVADSNATVLIEGESGTGKTLVARLLHEASPRRHKPFLEVSCAVLSETLLESELFGHVKGSFTSAASDRQGKFQVADGGTILLDEITSATPSLQMKLLRVVQHCEFERIGDNETISVDVRIVTATNRSLEEAVRKGTFRADLFHRLNVVRIQLPPLRERIGDIPP